MDTESKELIKNRIEELPEALKVLVNAESWRETVARIARQFNLKEEQAVALENEVFLTLLCFEPPADFKQNIKTELGLDENAGRRIADSINGSIFGPVMKDIKQAWKPTPSLELRAKSLEVENQKQEPPSLDTNSSKLPAPSLDITYEDITKAMKPARLASESVAGGPAVNKTESPKPVEDYKAGNDPYRETLE